MGQAACQVAETLQGTGVLGTAFHMRTNYACAELCWCLCHADFVVAVNDILPHVMAVLEAEPEEEALAKASAPLLHPTSFPCFAAL